MCSHTYIHKIWSDRLRYEHMHVILHIRQEFYDTFSNEAFNAFKLTFINSCGSLHAYYLNIMSIDSIFMLYKRESPNCVIKTISCDIRCQDETITLLNCVYK